MECNCFLNNSNEKNVHELWCRTNNEYELYKCSECGLVSIQYSMSFGRCLKCNEEKTGRTFRFIIKNELEKISTKQLPTFIKEP